MMYRQIHETLQIYCPHGKLTGECDCGLFHQQHLKKNGTVKAIINSFESGNSVSRVAGDGTKPGRREFYSLLKSDFKENYLQFQL